MNKKLLFGVIASSLLILAVTVKGKGNPIDEIWDAINNLQDRIDALNVSIIALEQRPFPPEICDNLDNDADGLIDEDVMEKEKCGTGECEGIRERSCSNGIWDFWSDCSTEGQACFRGICQGGICIITDNDGDGIPNSEDNCPDVSNPDQIDTDEDGLGNECDGDDDGDGIGDGEDNCPIDTGNDADGDGVCISDGDFDDNDPSSYPGAPEIPDGKDNDGDGLIDEECETDADCPTQTECKDYFTYRSEWFLYEKVGNCVNGECVYGDWTFTNCTLSKQYCNAECDSEDDCFLTYCNPDSCLCE